MLKPFTSKLGILLWIIWFSPNGITVYPRWHPRFPPLAYGSLHTNFKIISNERFLMAAS
jgi:hypothetical protein